MRPAERFIVLALVLAVLTSSTEALFKRRGRKESDCDEVPAGTWNVEHYGRQGPEPKKSGDLIGRSLLNITRSFGTAYTGNGAGIYYTDRLDSVNGYEFVYQIIVNLNPEYCTLSGSLYNLETTPAIIGAVKWHFDGEKISGPVNILEKQLYREAYDVSTREWFELTLED